MGLEPTTTGITILKIKSIKSVTCNVSLEYDRMPGLCRTVREIAIFQIFGTAILAMKICCSVVRRLGSRLRCPFPLHHPSNKTSKYRTGSQNDVRYAYFAQSRRLAIEVNGKVTVYDTLDHQISGFSQQQSRGASLTFASQHGLVAVASLPVASVVRVPLPASPPVQEEPVRTQSVAREADVFATIEKLAQLHAKGILSDEEFAAKKAELLSRL